MQMTVREFAMYAMIINVVIGVILGLIVWFLGRKKGKGKIGLIGLIVTIAGSALAGLFLSIPSFIVFLIIILFTKVGVGQVDETVESDSDDN